MIFNEDNVEVLTVNYNTPDFIIKQYKSVRQYISPNISYHIIDGSDKELNKRGQKILQLQKKLEDLISEDPHSHLTQLGYNIHHGPGMDLGIRKSNKPYSLIIDSDQFLINKGILEHFSNECKVPFICCGAIEYVDITGHSTPNKNGIKYVHPSFILVDNKKYELINGNFIKHGAPAIEVMKCSNKNELIDIPNLSTYTTQKRRGTINLYGLNI